MLVLFGVSLQVTSAASYWDLTSYQKQQYWKMWESDCQPLLVTQQYTDYRTCALNVMEKASKLVEPKAAWCTDSDGGIDWLKKGVVKTDLNPVGVEDYVYTFSDGSQYLLEAACSDTNEQITYYKNCAELGVKYVADVSAGACVLKNAAPVIEAVGDKTVNGGQLLTITVNATDKDGDTLIYSVAPLPIGATFVDNVFSWNSPNKSGTHQVVFTVSDGTVQVSQTVKITVVSVNSAPVIESIPDQVVKLNHLLTFKVIASDANGDNIVLSPKNLPAGATFQNNVFSWVPLDKNVKEWVVTFVAFDGVLSSEKSVKISIMDDEKWSTISNINAPSKRNFHSAVWTGKEMIVWGGSELLPDGNVGLTNTGSRYNPVTNTWNTISTVGAPKPRHYDTIAVWTGKEMIIWGGTAKGDFLTDGARYNPVTDLWTPLSLVNAPTFTNHVKGEWNGDSLILWGQSDYDGGLTCNNIGVQYDPSIDKWSSLPISPLLNPTGKKCYELAGVTDTKMILWGGIDYSINSYTSGIWSYDFQFGTWKELTQLNSPEPSYEYKSFVVNNSIVIYGGLKDVGSSCGNPGYANAGQIYDIKNNSWTTFKFGSQKTICDTDVKSMHWSGSEVILFRSNSLVEGFKYNPETNTHVSIDTSKSSLIGLKGSTSVWTGKEVLIWGGMGFLLSPSGTYSSAYNTSGAKYQP